MVIGDRFVWAHMPKTGGDSTHELFRIINPDLHIDCTRQADKHHTFVKRERTTGLDLTHRRRRILNIRRLPSWLLSYGKHRERVNGYTIDQELLKSGRIIQIQGVPRAQSVAAVTSLFAIAFPKSVQQKIRRQVIYWLTRPGETTLAERPLRSMMCGRIDHWIRLEHLADDFLHVVSQYEQIGEEQRAAVRSMQPKNTGDYQKELDEWFSRDELARIYESNPMWTALEREVYGAALIDLDAPGQAA